jgi:integrase
MISRNTSQAVIKPKLIKKEMMVLDENQVQSFLLAARESRHQMIYFLAIATGLREGELLGLYWSDIDWVNRRIQIKRQLQRLPQGKGLAFSEPKSRAGRRVIIVGPMVLEKLREHMSQQQLVCQFAGDRWQENDLVFPSSIGTPMEWRNMVRDFKDTLQRAGLPNIRFHDLRHTAATLMLKQGIHPKVVQERLGHSQISLTLDTYSHVLPSMQEEAAEKLDQLLTPISISVGQSNETISNE